MGGLFDSGGGRSGCGRVPLSAGFRDGEFGGVGVCTPSFIVSGSRGCIIRLLSGSGGPLRGGAVSFSVGKGYCRGGASTGKCTGVGVAPGRGGGRAGVCCPSARSCYPCMVTGLVRPSGMGPRSSSGVGLCTPSVDVCSGSRPCCATELLSDRNGPVINGAVAFGFGSRGCRGAASRGKFTDLRLSLSRKACSVRAVFGGRSGGVSGASGVSIGAEGVSHGIVVRIGRLTVRFGMSGSGVSALGRCIVEAVGEGGGRRRGVEVLSSVSFGVCRKREMNVLKFGNTKGDALLEVVTNVCRPDRKRVGVGKGVTPLLRLDTKFSGGCAKGGGVFLGNTLLDVRRSFVGSGCSRVIRFSRLKRRVGCPIGGCSGNVETGLNFSVTALVGPRVLVVSRVLTIKSVGFEGGDSRGVGSVVGSNIAMLLMSRSVDRVEGVYSEYV